MSDLSTASKTAQGDAVAVQRLAPALLAGARARLPAALTDPRTQLVTTALRKTVAHVAAPAGRARLQPRHRWLLASFIAVVLAPVLISAWYLWARAADQYASVMGFSVHREDIRPASSLLGGLVGFSGSGSADTDILYQYIHSQQLVAELDAALDLQGMWSKPVGDPVFAYDSAGNIEELVDYWRDMVRVRYDTATRLIDVQVRAFDPADAQAITTAILARSTEMINRLNDVASADAFSHARAEVARASDALIQARADVTRFRNQHQMVDPSMELVAQSSVISVLQQELTGAQVHLDMLRTTTQQGDRRVAQAEQRVAVIEAQITTERGKLGLGTGAAETDGYAGLVAEYERLAIERQFAEETYRAARVAFEVAQADATRQGRYLAAHILPTLPESARYPARVMALALIAAFALALWSIAALVYYALRDRR
jgi:capsular polysaccharide transport system permease protein